MGQLMDNLAYCLRHYFPYWRNRLWILEV